MNRDEIQEVTPLVVPQAQTSSEASGQVMKSITIIGCVAIAAFALIAIFDKGEKGLALFDKMLTPLITAAIGLLVWRRGEKKGEELKILMNGRLTQLLSERGKAAHAEGMNEGMKTGLAVQVECPVSDACPGGCPTKANCPHGRAPK